MAELILPHFLEIAGVQVVSMHVLRVALLLYALKSLNVGMLLIEMLLLLYRLLIWQLGLLFEHLLQFLPGNDCSISIPLQFRLHRLIVNLTGVAVPAAILAPNGFLK